MTTSSSHSSSARFDLFQVDLSSGELTKSGGDSTRIQQQPLQVLRLLLEAEGRVVSREQLRAALWPDDTFVDFEHGVNTAVKKLRQALGDSVENPKFVETVPKVGYRFLASVEWVTDFEHKHPSHAVPEVVFKEIPVLQPKPPKRSLTTTILGVAAIFVIGILTVTLSLPKPVIAIQSARAVRLALR